MRSVATNSLDVMFRCSRSFRANVPGIIILVPYFLVMKTSASQLTLGAHSCLLCNSLPLCVWMLKGFFDTIPRELEEAAALDGCNQFQVFTKVVYHCRRQPLP